MTCRIMLNHIILPTEYHVYFVGGTIQAAVKYQAGALFTNTD